MSKMSVSSSCTVAKPRHRGASQTGSKKALDFLFEQNYPFSFRYFSNRQGEVSTTQNKAKSRASDHNNGIVHKVLRGLRGPSHEGARFHTVRKALLFRRPRKQVRS